MIAYLPRASRCDKQGFKSSVFYPPLNRFRHELRSIVRSDELRDSTLHDKAVELSNDVLRGHRSSHTQAHEIAAVFIQNWQPFETTTIVSLIKDKVVAPNMVNCLSLV